jgi:hypothetical protein
VTGTVMTSCTSADSTAEQWHLHGESCYATCCCLVYPPTHLMTVFSDVQSSKRMEYPTCRQAAAQKGW